MVLTSLSWLSTPSSATALLPLNQDEVPQAAKLLALLLDAGRQVLARHQDLINDPTLGGKGWTLATFEAEIIEEFARHSGGIDLHHRDRLALPQPTIDLLLALLQAGLETIEDRRHVINQKFLGYKNVIPATWGTWTAAKFSARTRVRIKQTALDFRNPANAPDPVETEVLRRFADPSYPRTGDRGLSMFTRDRSELRYFWPLFHQQDCLVCHGQPKGEIDISGYAKEGHAVGDSAGAISVTIPLTATTR